MVPFGETAARSVADQLAKYSIPEAEFQARLERIRRIRDFSDAKVRSVELTQSSTADPKFVLRQVKTRPGDPLELEAIREDLERLYETGDYERIDFRLRQVESDFELYIEAIDKPWGPNYLRFGLNMFADLEGESSFDALADYTMTRLNRKRGEFKIQAQLGEHPTVVAELYQPFSLRQTWFAAVKARQTTTTEYLSVPVAAGAVAPYRTGAVEIEADLGIQLGRYAELRLGLARGSATAEARGDDDSGPPTGLPHDIERELGGIHFSAVVDQFDNMNFPREGYFVVTDYLDSREELGADVEYQHLNGFVGLAGTRGRHTLLGLSSFFSALDSEHPEVFAIGGLFKLSGVPEASITGHYGGYATALYLYRLADLPIGLGNGIYVGGSIEAGNLWDTKAAMSLDELRYSGTLTLGADTAFGPAYLAVGVSEGGEQALYLFIGRTF